MYERMMGSGSTGRGSSSSSSGSSNSSTGSSAATAGIAAFMSTQAVVEASKSASISRIILAVGLAIPALAQVALLYLGRLPPPQVSQQQASRFPATSVFLFTGIVRIGVMANYTVILPFAAAMSASSGQGSDDSGYLIAVTSFGCIAGAFPFWLLPVEKLRIAYICHGIIVLLGNTCWALAGQIRSFTLLTISRIFVGLEAGVGYNTGIGLAHHATGDALTTCMFIMQCCQDIGILLGPVLAASSTWLVKLCGSNNTQLQQGGGNLLMALYGIMLVVALLVKGPLPDPPDEEKDREVQAQLENTPDPQKVPKSGSPRDDIDETNSEGKNNALGLLLAVVQTAYLRHTQRLLFESGMIYILQVHYQWSAEASGLVMVPTVAYCALLEALLVLALRGVFSDKTLLFAFEVKQVLGCTLMLYATQTKEANSIPVFLILGGMVTYGGNALCGAASTALCVKRYIPGGIASRNALTIGGHTGVFLGCFFGALASRVVLGASPSPHSLAQLMLVMCCLQFITSYLTFEMPESPEDRTQAVLALGLAGAIGICALLPAIGGLGFGNLFAQHAAFMALAWVGAAPLGKWALRTKYFPETWRREQRRTVHDVCMAVALVLSVAGLVAACAGGSQTWSRIFGGSQLHGSEGLVAGGGWTREVHAFLGFAVICAVVVHLGASAVRHCFADSDDRGSEESQCGALPIGGWTCNAALLTAAVGLWVSFPELAHQGGWSLLLKGTLSAGLLLLACTLHWHLTRQAQKNIEYRLL